MSSVKKEKGLQDSKNQHIIEKNNENNVENNLVDEDSALIDLINVENNKYTNSNDDSQSIHKSKKNNGDNGSKNKNEAKNNKSRVTKNAKNGTKHSKNNPQKSKPVPKAIPKNLILIVTGIVVLLLLIAILSGHIYFRNRWYINTTINNTNVESEKLSDTLSYFDKTYNDYSLTLNGRQDMKDVIAKDDIDLKIESNDCIKEAFDKQHSQFYLFALLQPQKLEAKPAITYSDEKLNSILENSLLVKGDKDHPIISPKNANAEFSNEKGYFAVRPEVEGNTINKDTLATVTKDALAHTITEVNLDDSKEYPNMFAAPEIKAKGSGLQETCDAYNNVAIHWINWKMTDDITVSLTPQDIAAWYDMDDNYKLTLNNKKVETWTEQFCLKYKTVGKTRDFKNHAGNIIKVSGGDYGWQMDYQKTVDQIMNILNADNNEKIKVYLKENNETNKAALTSNLDAIYLHKGAKFDPANPTNDYSLTNYSEISIAEQMVYVYRDGKLAHTAHCITGLPTAERQTSKGCWYVKERLRNKTLVGPGYQTPVSYWVRITWSGIGYHDATWQNWGGWNPSRYKSVGSHGCINLSMSDVSKIYELVRVGDPVFIY